MSWKGFTSEWYAELEKSPRTRAGARVTNSPAEGEIAEKRLSQPPREHKYGANPKERDGIKFQSTLEADRYRELTLLKAAGDVSHFLRQTPIHLPGGTKLQIDFLVFWRDGRITYEDTKGYLTPSFKIKRREVEFLYPFKVTILKRKDVPQYEF